ncbi:MAG TPA: tRNA pseudouridine(55) synthase TruB [Casimicrobiaceae bacterium]|jgi:tRNA pseudouridine55 synthase
MKTKAGTVSRRRVDGVLLLDKPPGLSSNAVLQRAKRLFNAEKAGHTGTLDPMASGLLPLCFGEATKFARFLLDADKRYRAEVRFGVTTTTHDAEGDVVVAQPVALDRTQIEAALPAFTGELRQTPPAHSALKFQGRNYYEYARKGIEIPRAARDVEVKMLTLIDWSTPIATLDVVCSKGTYIRTLAADLGGALGCGAHLAGLRRSATGGFGVEQAISLDGLAEMDVEARDALLRPVDCLLDALPRLDVAGDDATRLRHGRSIDAPARLFDRFRAYGPDGDLVGVLARVDDMLVPDRLMRYAS